MAKQKVNQALSIRSAESLGRVIGALHRQLDSTIHRFTGRPVHRPKTENDNDVTERTVRHSSSRAPRLAASEPRTARRTKPAAKKTTPASGSRATSSEVKRAARPK
jgi:hypothetical protein